jgi:hypothetical protein
MKFSPRSLPKSPKSFRRTLLRRPMHKFSALPPVTRLDGITYRRNAEKSRKSFRRLLLPLFVPVSPLGAHSYKKMGVSPSALPSEALAPERSYADSLDPNTTRSCATRPCLSPLESYSYEKRSGGCEGKERFFARQAGKG